MLRITRSLRFRSSCTGAAAARGDAGEARREEHASIPIPLRRSTVAPFLQPALSTSAAVMAPSDPQLRLVSSAGLLFSLSSSRNATGLDQDDKACLDALDCYRRMHPPDAAIRAAHLSPRLEAAQHLLKRPSLPSSRLLRLPLTGARLCSKPAPRHACRRAPPLRVDHGACSDCVCLPVMLDKQRLCTAVLGPLLTLRQLRRRGAALLIRHNFQIDYSDAAFTLTLVLAGPSWPLNRLPTSLRPCSC